MSAIKVAFGVTLLNQGTAGAGIDGIGHYCKDLITQFEQLPQAIDLKPFNFGPHASSKQLCLPSYSKYLIHSSLGLNSTQKNIFDDVDIVHSTDQLIPLVRNKPLIATVMDTIPLSHPQFLKIQSRHLKPFLWKKLTQRADHIITISEFSKQEISRLLNYPDKNITVIPLGVNEEYFTPLAPESIKAALDQLRISTPFFLFLGSIQPRKNLQNVLKAHAALPRNLATQFPLVIAGKLAWDDGHTLTQIQQGIKENRCIWLSYIGEHEKRCLLQTTLGMVFASHYEGFGLPILEAFASGAPVITSDCTSMPEVAGNAAILVNPQELDQITNAMHSLIDDCSLKNSLVAKGLARAKEFTWGKTALATLDTYRSTLSQ